MKIAVAISLTAMMLGGGSAVDGQTLREAAAKRSVLIGAAADADERGAGNRLDEPEYASTLAAQFNMLEAENAMKWGPIHPSRDRYNFGPADQLVAFAQTHAMKVRGHNLLWGLYNPAWLTQGRFSSGQLATILQDHIRTVVTHYKGQVFAWDVVNEAVNDSGTGFKDSIWFNRPGIGLKGSDFIEQAFEWAHAADPAALLFYNDYGLEHAGKKFEYVYSMLRSMVTRGVPVNGVGLQMHITAEGTHGLPTLDDLRSNMERLTALGLQVHITEMDVRVPVDQQGNATPEDLAAQAQTYRDVMALCLKQRLCTAVQTWGFTDKYSWIPKTYPGFGAALPFDTQYRAKPAVAAMLDAFLNDQR